MYASSHMHKGRLEAFSDAVIAILMTIMVLELRPPHEITVESLRPLAAVFGSYLLSFVFLAIYWNNHHHMLQASRHVSGSVLWANMHLLFWLSLVPFTTAWMGETGFKSIPVAAYGLVLLGSAVGYTILQYLLVGVHGRESDLALALGSDLKGKISLLSYVAAVPIALAAPWLSCTLYVFVALLWLIPDRRFENLKNGGQK